MKITRHLAILASLTVLGTSAMAQSQLSCDCIAASPRVRQMMQDQQAMLPPMGGGEFVEGETIRGQVVVAPPRAREQMMEEENQRTAAVIIDNEPERVGYRATCHGITASPKVHQMLKDRRQMVEIYEVK